MKINHPKIDILLVFLVFSIFVLTLAIAARTFPAFADNSESSETPSEFLVTIHDSNSKITIKTDAPTVGEALKRANISLAEHDIVDPAPDTEIISNSYRVTVLRARPAVVVDGHRRIRIMTATSDPRSVVNLSGIALYDEDIVEITPSNVFLEAGVLSVFSVTRAKIVNFLHYGVMSPVRTQASTVGEFLKENGISISSNDWLSLPQGTVITDGINLELMRQGKNVFTVEEPIPFGETTIFDFDRPRDYRVIDTPGVLGRKTVTYEIEMKDGEELSRKVISELILSQPVNQVVIVGRKQVLPEGDHTDWMRAAGIAEEDFGYVNYIVWRESRWNPNAVNRSSGACGLVQFFPCSPEKAGVNWNDPINALQRGQAYAIARYGSWERAYRFWIANNWW
jgi:uncharacterized protein YabE (DUF348 family)